MNHRSIVWDDRAQEISIYHVELLTHDVLIADGAPAESYRDDGNRWLFHNANSGWGCRGSPLARRCLPADRSSTRSGGGCWSGLGHVLACH